MKIFNCEFSYFNKIPNANSLVLSKCSDIFQVINFYGLYYGLFNKNIYAFIIFFILLIPILFVILSIIADRYLSDSMSKLTDRIKISESFAAITILAFANSAPDLITTIIQSDSGEGNLSIIGQLIGSMIFSSTVGLSYILYKSQVKKIQIDKRIVIKEFLFYFTLIFLILSFAVIGHINMNMIMIFFSTYIIYLIVSVILNKLIIENDMKIVNWENIEFVSKKTSESFQSKEFFNVILLPLELIWRLTIPYENNIFLTNNLTKFFTYFFSSLFIFFIFGITIGRTLLLICLFISLFSFFIKYNDKLNFYFRENFVIISSLAWIFLCASLISDVLTLISLNLHISNLFLVTIFLAIGNTIGDVFSNGSLSKIGKSKMAFYGVFSCQSFNFLLAFGINNLRSILSDSDKKIKFVLFNGLNKDNIIKHLFILIIILLSFFNLIFIFFYLYFNKFTLKRKWIKYLLIIEFLFITISCIFEFKFKINN